jgi:hypothetical protein
VIEVQADGVVLPHTAYDRIAKIEKGMEIDKKLRAARSLQDTSDFGRDRD